MPDSCRRCADRDVRTPYSLTASEKALAARQIGEHIVDHGFATLELDRVHKLIGLMGLVD